MMCESTVCIILDPDFLYFNGFNLEDVVLCLEILAMDLCFLYCGCLYCSSI